MGQPWVLTVRVDNNVVQLFYCSKTEEKPVMIKWVNLLLCSLFLILPTHSYADQIQTAGKIKLSYGDGKPATIGLDGINAVLRSIGC